MRRLRILSIVVLVWIFAIMMLGGYTKAIGAGLACPDWPKCYGQWFPPWPEDAQFTTHQIGAEWIHRALVGSFAVPMLALAFVSWRRHEAHNVVRYTPLIILGVLALQVVLGGLTVTGRLDPVIVTSHLGTATIIFGMAVVHTVMMYARPYADPARSIPPANGGQGPDHAAKRPADGVWRDTGDASGSRPLETAPAADVPNEGPAAVATPAVRTVGAVVRDYVNMTKPRVMFLLILTAMTSMFIATGGIPQLWPTFGIVLGGMLATAGSGAINHFVERDVDRGMERTRDRPVASGRVPASHAMTFGVSLGILSFLITWHFANLLAAFFVIAGLLFYVFVYTLWLKRITSLNIVIGGAAGGFPVLAGWAAATGGVDLGAWLFFALIFVWTPPHFWALALVLKDDYAKAKIPMLPSVKGVPRTTTEILIYSVATVAVSFAFYVLGVLGLVYLLAAALLGGLFLVLALQLHQEPTKRSARQMFGYSILYLGLLCIAAFVDVTVLA